MYTNQSLFLAGLFLLVPVYAVEDMWTAASRIIKDLYTHIASALPGTLKIAFRSAPAAGTVVAAGADYTLTENDLSNLISLNEGVRFALVNGQIVTAE